MFLCSSGYDDNAAVGDGEEAEMDIPIVQIITAPERFSFWKQLGNITAQFASKHLDGFAVHRNYSISHVNAALSDALISSGSMSISHGVASAARQSVYSYAVRERKLISPQL